MKLEPKEKKQEQSKGINSKKKFKKNTRYYLFFNWREQEFIDQLRIFDKAAISFNNLEKSNAVSKEDYKIGEFFIISFEKTHFYNNLFEKQFKIRKQTYNPYEKQFLVTSYNFYFNMFYYVSDYSMFQVFG